MLHLQILGCYYTIIIPFHSFTKKARRVQTCDNYCSVSNDYGTILVNFLMLVFILISTEKKTKIKTPSIKKNNIFSHKYTLVYFSLFLLHYWMVKEKISTALYKSSLFNSISFYFVSFYFVFISR